MKRSTDVLVVGAGPVGLLLAGELQRRAVDHLLIEQRRAPAYFCKALGVSPRTLELFDQIGVLHEALDHGLRLRGQISHENGAHVQTITYGPAETPYLPLALAQYDTEEILRAHLRRHGGRVHGGTALQSFEASNDRIVARVKLPRGAEHAVECRYLVGCDGAHSAVRHGLGLDYEGDAYPLTFMLGDVLLRWQQPRGYAHRMVHTENGELRNVVIGIPIPGDPRRYRLSMVAPVQDDAGAAGPDPDLREIESAAAPALPPGTKLSDLRWSSLYRISHRIAPRYSGGRVFVAGDAAHIHPPIGGQGMNTGLQDAFNLSWKLALACAGRAAPGLLDSYSAERQPVGMDVVSRTTRRMDRAVASGQVEEAAEELRLDSQLFVRYRASAWVGENLTRPDALAGGPRPGDRAPDARGLQRPSSDQPTRLAELLSSGRHTLLFYAGETSSDEDYRRIAEIADALRSRHGDHLAAYAIVTAQAQPLDLERVPLLVDVENRFRGAYGVAGASLYLVRPDGHVGYRADGLDTAGLDAHLARVLRA